MKLIIECDNGIYAYRQTEKSFKRQQKTRLQLKKLNLKSLDDDCNLSHYYGYFVINLTKKSKTKRGTSLDR